MKKTGRFLSVFYRMKKTGLVKKIMVYMLDDHEIYFPVPELANEDGLLAVGGDLSVDRLVLAYSNGIFPWFDSDDEYLWWCPKERFVILPEEIHVSHSMKKFMKRHDTHIIINGNFADTIHRCRMKREHNEGTWITDDMENAYIALNRAGYAVSAESYIDGEQAGGLYGVVVGRCFFGESMFSDKENGSKIALILLARLLQEKGFVMIDCQFHTDHLESMGGKTVNWQEYRWMLDEGIK